MSEPVRLACPDCQLVYRIKRLVPGKNYTCRQCGANLRALEPISLVCPSCGDAGEKESFEPANPPRCDKCEEAPALAVADAYEASIAQSNVVASSSAHNAVRGAGDEPSGKAGGDLARLPRLIEDLAARLEEFRLFDAEEKAAAAETGRRMLEEAERLTANLGELNARLDGNLGDLDQKVASLLERFDRDEMTALSQQVRETGEMFLARLEEYGEAQKTELAALLQVNEEDKPELNLDILAEKVAAGVRMRTPRMDEESGSAVDALARVADELVKEQNANTLRLDRLASELNAAMSKLSGFDALRGELSERVADEIGRNIGEKVIGPLSGALSRQAPAILADLQDNKLVDIVSRSVREAQRPLLREILAGGRNGVPGWLFALVLLLLLGLMGYLFLPGELGFGKTAARLDAIAEGFERIEQLGVPLDPADRERLASVEGVVLDIHGEALAHVRNAATLEEEVRNLNATLKEKEAMIGEFSETVQRQTRRLRALENRLTRLGVSPDTVEE